MRELAPKFFYKRKVRREDDGEEIDGVDSAPGEADLRAYHERYRQKLTVFFSSPGVEAMADDGAISRMVAAREVKRA